MYILVVVLRDAFELLFCGAYVRLRGLCYFAGLLNVECTESIVFMLSHGNQLQSLVSCLSASYILPS